MAKFATNKNELASIKLSPFFAVKGFYLHISFNIVNFSNTSICEQIFKHKTLDISRKMETTQQKFAQKALAAAQKSQSKQADKYWKDITYAIKDKV